MYHYRLQNKLGYKKNHIAIIIMKENELYVGKREATSHNQDLWVGKQIPFISNKICRMQFKT
jgi:hypothetical protein